MEKRRKKQRVNHVDVVAERSRELRELRGAVAAQLTQVLAEVEQVRPLQEAPAGVDQFVAAAERTLAALQEGAQAE